MNADEEEIDKEARKFKRRKLIILTGLTGYPIPIT